MSSHDSARFDPAKEGYQGDFGDHISRGAPPQPPQTIPVPQLIEDPQVIRWAARTHNLKPGHRQVLLSIAAFCTPDGSAVSLSYEALAGDSGLCKRAVIEKARDLEIFGIIHIRRDIIEDHNQYPNEFRLHGIHDDWQPAPRDGEPLEVVSYLQQQVRSLDEYVLRLEAELPPDHPATLTKPLQNLHPEEEEDTYINSNRRYTSPSSSVSSPRAKYAPSSRPDEKGCHESYESHVEALLDEHPDIVARFDGGRGAARFTFLRSPGKLEQDIEDLQKSRDAKAIVSERAQSSRTSRQRK